MVRDRVQSFVDTLDLDDLGAARAEVALTLAVKLDQAGESTSPGVAQSVASIARELRETMEVLAESQVDTQQFLADLFEAR